MSDFQKTILAVGTYESPDGIVEVTPARLRHWEKMHKALSDNRQVVPIDWDHADNPASATPLSVSEYKKRRSAANTVGHMKDFKVASDGKSAEILLSIPDQQAAQKARDNLVFVSPVIFHDWKDGSGKSYNDVITHVDLVNHPVDHSQSGFSAMSILRCGLDQGRPQSFRLAMMDEEFDIDEDDEDEDEEDVLMMGEDEEEDDEDELDEDLYAEGDDAEVDSLLSDESGVAGGDIEGMDSLFDEEGMGEDEDDFDSFGSPDEVPSSDMSSIDTVGDDLGGDFDLGADDLDAGMTGEEIGFDLPAMDEEAGPADDTMPSEMLDYEEEELPELPEDGFGQDGFDMSSLDDSDEFADPMSDLGADLGDDLDDDGDEDGVVTLEDDTLIGPQISEDLMAIGIAAPEIDPDQNPKGYLKELCSALRQKKMDEGLNDPDAGEQEMVQQPEMAALSLQVRRARQESTAMAKKVMKMSLVEIADRIKGLRRTGRITPGEYNALANRMKAVRFSLDGNGDLNRTEIHSFIESRETLPENAAFRNTGSIDNPLAVAMSVQSRGNYAPQGVSRDDAKKHVDALAKERPDLFN